MLYAAIMAGGRGERFWPKSREKRPKQLLSLMGAKGKIGYSMIQNTIYRIRPIVKEDGILIITNKEHAGSLKEQLSRADNFSHIKEKNIIVEPFGRNTASCIGLAAVLLHKKDPQGTMVVLPSDHLIEGNRQFLDNILAAEKVARTENALVTIGMKPVYPATGYGYIKVIQNSKSKIKDNCVYKVEGFVEKPDRKTAQKFLRSSRYFWNAGIFVWKVEVILNAIKEHMPKLYTGLKKIENSIGTRNFRDCLYNVYSKLDKISIDYGVMEKAKNVSLVVAGFAWDDMGSWLSLERTMPKDSNGNIILGHYTGLNTKDSIIVSEDECLVGTIGISNLIIVKTDDAVLICKKDKAEDVKNLVDGIRKNKRFHKYL